MDNTIAEYKKRFKPTSQKSVVRPFMGGLTWKNKSSLISEKVLDEVRAKNEPLIDLTTISEAPNSNLGFFRRMCFYGYIATFVRKVPSDYPHMKDMKKLLLEQQSLHVAIQKTICTSLNDRDLVDISADKKMEAKLYKEAGQILDKMISTVTSPVIRFCGWLYVILLKRLTSAVHVHKGQIDVIREISKSPYPIVYLPLHFSHLDYILLSLVLFHHEIRCPFVASGDNLHLPLFSYFMRRAGGFFIRRKSNDVSKKDLIYRSLLNSFVIELLKKKQSIEIFIEGGRTRSGLPNYPKTGLLSILVEAVVNGEIDDIIVVPTCISYEKLIEGNFSNELMGLPKRRESFFNSILEIGKMLCGSYGHIRMDFGQPRLLKQSLQEICSFCEIDMKDFLPSSAVIQNSKVGSYEDLITADDVWKNNINLIGEHLVYACLQTRSYMSTQLVSFLLLHRFRHGVSMTTLVRAFTTLNSYLLSLGHDVGYCGVPEDIVVHALSILGSKLITCENRSKPIPLKRRASKDSGCEIESEDKGSEENLHSDSMKRIKRMDSIDEISTGEYMSMDDPFVDEILPQSKKESTMAIVAKGSPRCHLDHFIYVTPTLRLPEVFDLVYYANALTPVFALESLVALAITAVTEFKFSMITGLMQANSEGILVSSLPNNIRLPFLRSKLLSKAMELASLLNIDIILCDVTDNIEQMISNAIDSLVSKGCLLSEQYGTSAATRKSHLAQELCFEEEDDYQDLQEKWITIDLQNVCELMYYQSILLPHVKGYAIVASKLTMLMDTSLTEREFISTMSKEIRDVENDESCASSIVKCALHSFIENSVVDKLFDSSLALTVDYNDEESISFFYERYLQYVP